MRYELLKKYEKKLEDGSFYRMMVDQYELDFNKNEYYKVTKDNKLIKIDETSSEEDKLWIKDRDLLSEYINQNKRISNSNSNIMSNNYMTLIVKIKCFNSFVIKKGDKRPQEIQIEKYFDELYSFYYEKSETRMFEVEKVDKEQFEVCKELLINYFNCFKSKYTEQFLLEQQEKMNKTEFKLFLDKKIKIFVDEDLHKYKKEINKYLINKVFIKEKYVENKNDLYYGIPLIGQTVNDNKKFLFNYTMPNIYNSIMSLKECIWLYLIDIHIKSLTKSLKKNGKIYLCYDLNIDDVIISINEYEKSHGKLEVSAINTKTGLQIKDVSIYTGKKEEFTLYNFMNIKDPKKRKEKVYLKDRTIQISSLYEMLYDFVKDNRTIKDQFNWKLLKTTLDKTPHLFKKQYQKTLHKFLIYLYKDYKQATKQIPELINIWLSLDEYYKGEEDLNKKEKFSIKDFRDYLNIKVKEGIDLETNDEFLFLYGQVYYYVNSHSESIDKSIYLFNLPLKLNNSKKLIVELKRKVKYYSHCLPRYNKKFTNALALLYSYELHKEEFNSNNFLHMGLMFQDNIMYISEKKVNDEENGGKE